MKKELDKSYIDYNGEIPKKFTLPEDRIPPVHNQHIGTSDYRCMAYATTGIMRIMWRVYSGEDVDFSEAYVYGKYRRENNRIGRGMFVSDLMPGVVNGGCVPQDAMPDIKKEAEGYDYVKAHPELDEIAKPYASMFEGYVSLKGRTKLETLENTKKALLQFQLPVYGEYVGHAIIFVGWNEEKLYYRDCDGTKSLKLLSYKDIKESYLFMMAEKETKKFIDVPDYHWAKDAIEYCAEKGYMNGVDADSFDPNKPLTRAEIAQILYNYDKAVGRA